MQKYYLYIYLSMNDLGVIFHWGLYSVPAYFETASKTYEGNGSEWYQARLEDKGTWRPLAGHQKTKDYHLKHFGSRPYSDFAQEFKAEKWDPDQWMTLCKSVGATYVILTSKHHDGYCLWPTATTDYNSLKTGPKRDLIGEFAQSARKHGLKFGIYYSWMEFNRSCTIDYMTKVVRPQVQELIAYQPDIFWFDGDWECKSISGCQIIKDLCTQIKHTLPYVQINDRLGAHQSVKENRQDPNYLGSATYRNYTDRALPAQSPSVPWEPIHTIGQSWGRNQVQQATQYKTGPQLFSLYKQVQALNGRFLLNLGPSADGSLDPHEEQSLKDFGSLVMAIQTPKIKVLFNAQTHV
jgi:alpha-L-fucosidase